MDYTKLLKKLSKSQIDPELLERINNLGKNHKDALTGLLDYRSFSWQLEEKIGQKSQFSLIAISIDFLQELNLISGWVVGDLALCGMSALLEELPYSECITGRISGATFMVYFPETDISLLRKWLDAASAKLALFEFPGLEMFPENHLTLSAGIYCNPNEFVKVEKGISEARQRLQFAQRQGGDNVVVLSDKQTVLKNQQAGNIDIKIRERESKNWLHTTFVELSLNGFSVIEKTPFLVREQLDVKLHSAKSEGSVLLQGTVVWRKPMAQSEQDTGFCLGVKFSNLGKEQLECLEQIMMGVN